MDTVYILWYDNGCDYTEVLSIHHTVEGAETARTGWIGQPLEVNSYSTYHPNELLIEEIDVLP